MRKKECEECGKEVEQRYASKYWADHWLCKECLTNEEPDEEDLEDSRLDKELKEIIVTTTPTIQGKKIVNYLDVISAELVEGLGIFKDAGAGLRDAFGGKAKGYQKSLSEMKEEAFIQLRLKAHELGANAITGITLDYGDLRGSMLMLVVNGTAVVTEDIK